MVSRGEDGLLVGHVRKRSGVEVFVRTEEARADGGRRRGLIVMQAKN
jgi:hypothetical protein